MLPKINACFIPPILAGLTPVRQSEWITPPSVVISKDTVQISEGKTRNFQCINAGFIKHTPIADGGLYGHVPTRPGCTTPQIRFLYVALHLWIVEDPGL